MSFGDTPREHLYTSQTHPYFRAPHIYVATPMRFMPGRKALTAGQARTLGVDPGYSSDTAETVFMTTRGGDRYTRTFMEGFIRPGPDLGNWASRAGLSALGIVPTGPAEMSLYKQAHYAQPSGHLVRHTQPHSRLNAGKDRLGRPPQLRTSGRKPHRCQPALLPRWRGHALQA